MTIRLLIADDHEVVRAGFCRALDESDIEVVAEASSGEEAVLKAVEVRPNVALVDIRMGSGDGFHALSRIKDRTPEVSVIMMSMYSNPTYVARASALGADDYVFKTLSVREMAVCIRRAANAEPPADDSPLSRMQNWLGRRERHHALPLTKRQTQVLRFIGLGLENREIAMSLHLSVDTVKEHVRCILRSLNFTHRTQAAVWASKSGFMDGFQWDSLGNSFVK